MATLNILVLVCVFYVIFLFVVAFAADRAALRGRGTWLRSPLVYTLSLSIYCTAWTFYGAVGFAARSGLEFVTIYLGPTLVMVGWWWGLRKLVRVGPLASGSPRSPTCSVVPVWQVEYAGGLRDHSGGAGRHALYRAATAIDYPVILRSLLRSRADDNSGGLASEGSTACSGSRHLAWPLFARSCSAPVIWT